MDSAEAIARARELYGALSEKDRKTVPNQQKLEDAESRLRELQERQRRIGEAEAAISGIGEVTLTSGEAIDRAQERYDALSGEDKEQVSNLSVLAAARDRLRELREQRERVDEVEAAISGIGEVTLDSAEAITRAYELYDALSGEEQKMVSNLSELAEAAVRFSQQREQIYQEAYDEAVSTMLDTLVIAENICNETASVWHNSIWKIDSEETDPFTKDASGAFYEKFDDALNAFYDSDEYLDMAYEMWENDDYISLLLIVIKDPPKKFSGGMLDAFADYYAEYQAFLALAEENSESYKSFTEKFDAVEETSISAYRKAAFYMSGS